ncbi:MAG: aminopeptidase [Candidatus Omnitrophota bacterium]|jgi:aminopeptidase|nr:MAG: aminopeptidase [Candidatus Omnitrophota bacterium]
MTQDRIRQLANSLVTYSTRVQSGDLVFITARGFDTFDLADAVAAETVKAGGVPYIRFEDDRALRTLLVNGNEETFKKLGDFLLLEMKQAQVFIGIRGGSNIFELADVPKEKIESYDKYITGPVHIEQRVKHTRWCVLRYPNSAMCQLAQTSTAAFQSFFYDVCCLDYSKMAVAVEPLRALMHRTDRVRIVAPDTDLQFSIKGIPTVKCTGENNIPDGECFTAPVRESINGTIRFNAASVHNGILYDSIRLTFHEGKAVEVDSGANTDRLRSVLTKDEGASYVGEFSFGFNPYILTPMKDTLFDEKIAGSIHMAMGSCYDDAPNGNKSALHWDLVQIQRPEYGGGEIYFDDVLIRKDGKFVIAELEGLNPEIIKDS